MKYLIILLATLALAESVRAQADPHPDGMSIYFDLEAFCFETHTYPQYFPITAFLMLTNPTTTNSEVIAWEARLTIEGNPMIPIPPRWTVIGNEYQDGLTNPDYVESVNVPITGPVTMLAHITITFIGYEVSPFGEFTIGPVPGSTNFPDDPGYMVEPGKPIPANGIFGQWNIPVAWINGGYGGCDPITFPTPAERMTWSAVKTLYED
jgi:hypothetical protein